MSNTVLQDRDHDVLRSLAFAVRLLTLRQTAKLRRADIANTRKRMAKLQDLGLVAAICIFAQAPPLVTQALCVCNPGDPLPHPGKLSYAAKKRYEKILPKSMTAYVATNQTLNRFGLTTKISHAHQPAIRFKHHQATHDIGLAACYIAHRHRWPKESWVGEDLFSASRAWGTKIEDAIIVGPDRDIHKPVISIDFLAKYSSARIRELTHALACRAVPFAFF